MRIKPLLQCLLIVSLLLGTSGVPSSQIVATKAQPILVAMATADPDQMVRVIVQKSGASDAQTAETRAVELGGKLTQDLHIINAFAAEMTAGMAYELSRSTRVRWVSLDAPMNSASTSDISVTWATSIGTLMTNQYLDAAYIVDGSGLGPNGSFGYRIGNGKGIFGGFNVEAVSGNAITRVELVLFAYANASFSSDYRIKPYINGAAQKEIKTKTTIFSSVIGAQNAGIVSLDITAAKSWKWVDFYNNLELQIEQAGFASNHTIYYDAVGLRITSAPGTDTSLETLTNPLINDSIVDGSQQVNVYNHVIGATQLWNTTNKLQGKNVTVAVVDSGIYKTEDLSHRIKVNLNFNPSYHDGIDRYGHGTFVAGIIAGNGKKSNGKYIGVAPKATLLNVRISDDQGMMYESDVVKSLQWVSDNKDKYNIRVVNLSLNSTVAQSYNTSPLDAAVEILWFNGIVVVVSAGNNGSSTLFPPANDPFVITVGATDDRATLTTTDDIVATFSAFGVTEGGLAKPDLVAPGRMIIGLLPDNGRLSMGQSHRSNRLDDIYFKMSGTSVSAPILSGAVAILLQDEPNLTPDQVKYRLMATANKNWPGYVPDKAGAGYLDIYAAVNGTTTESANTGQIPSALLWTGSDAAAWGSVSWNSVNWNSVSWNSVSWNSVSWNSDYWGP